jgi:hypothetical protein
MTPFIGVRNLMIMLARNSDLSRTDSNADIVCLFQFHFNQLAFCDVPSKPD